MKKNILFAALVLTFVSCSAPITEEVVVPTDSTSVVVDTTCILKCDSMAVDSCK